MTGAGAALALALLAAGCGPSGSSSGGNDAPPPPAAPAGPGASADLAGIWVARLEHNGQSREIALEVIPSEEGGLAARLTIPDLDVRSLPAGPVSVEGSQVRLGPLSLEMDSGRSVLRGVMPSALIPVHRIEVAFRKAPGLPPPGPEEPRLPSPSVRWTFQTGGPVWGGVALDREMVLAGSDDGILHALDPGSGREIWRVATGGALRARPAVDGGFIVVPSDDGHLYRLEASTGRQVWRVELGPPVQRLSPGEQGFRYDYKAPSVAISGDMIFAAHPGGELVALRAEDGSRIWSYTASDLVTATPTAGEGRIYLGSFDGRIRGLDAASGRLLWARDTGAPVTSSPALHGGHIIVGSRSYDLMALDARDGSPVWTYYCWFSWVESSPVVRDDVIYVGSSDAQLLNAIRAGNGTLLWSFDTGGSAWGRPAVTGEAVYIGSVGVAGYIIDHRGGFSAVNRESGQGVWRYEVPPTEGAAMWGFASSPVAGPEHVYVGGLDGKIYAFPLG